MCVCVRVCFGLFVWLVGFEDFFLSLCFPIAAISCIEHLQTSRKLFSDTIANLQWQTARGRKRTPQ